MQFEEEIKRSRFITYLAHTPGQIAAKAFVQSIKERHADARHNCWGFVAGAPNDPMQLGFSDDGEPSGTAGKPILAQLQGSGLGEVTAVVTRYSGGIKLGTGGLVKAYGGGVQSALKLIETEAKVLMEYAQLTCDYSQQSSIERLIQQSEGKIADIQFEQRVNLLFEVPLGNWKDFQQQLTHITQGSVTAQKQKSR